MRPLTRSNTKRDALAAATADHAPRPEKNPPDQERIATMNCTDKPNTRPPDGLSDQHWRDRANCVGADPNLFVEAERNPNPARRVHRKKTRVLDHKRAVAERYCRPCPVRRECASAAGKNTVGLYGGVYRTGSIGAVQRHDLLAAEWTSEDVA